jgi:hypothetical protein
LYADIKRQFISLGVEVEHRTVLEKLFEKELIGIKEICLLADYDKTPMEADNEVMGTLQQIALNYAPETNEGRRLFCHLLLRSYSLLLMVRRDGFRKEIEDKLEVNPFTMDDQWSRAIALGLDREPITRQSEKTVHLVIFGMSKVAEQVAINAAHVCHYPNYLKNEHTLRTRITVIDERASEKSSEWIQNYMPLFDNCYYRMIDTKKRPAVTNTSYPMYKDREDFVDIEWEFVSASPYDKLVRNKIIQWSTKPSQQLTIVFADYNIDESLNNALHLPEAVAAANIPIYVFMRSDKAFCQIKQSGHTPRIIPFGMVDYGYDINVPILKMAKNVNYIYDRCYEENDKDWNGHLRFAVEIDEEKKEASWARKSGVKRMSNIYNAMTIGVKMRSMGFNEEDWNQFYDMSQEDIEILAEVEHNRWSVEELILGWRPCTDKEQREVEIDINMKEELKKRKIHYDLRAYADLRSDGTGRPVQVYDRCLSACIPLIAKKSKGGEV